MPEKESQKIPPASILVEPATVLEHAAEPTKKLFRTQVIKNFLLYSLSSVLFKSTNIILMPLILAYLSPAEFGLLALSTTFITIVSAVLGMGMRSLVALDFFHETPLGQKKIIRTVVYLYLTIAIPTTIIMLLCTASLNHLAFASSASSFFIIVSILTGVLTFFSEFFIQWLRLTERAYLLITIQVCATAVIVLLKLWFIVSWHLAATGIILANFLGILLIVLWGLQRYTYELASVSRTRITYTESASLLKRSIPFVPSILFSWILSSADRWLLSRLGNLHDVGIYSLADTVSQFYQLCILYPLIGAYFPHIMKKFIEHNQAAEVERHNRKNMLLSMFLLSGVMILGSLTVQHLAVRWLPPSYQESLKFVLPLLLGQVLLTGAHFASCYLQYQKKIFALVTLLALPAIINIGLNYVLIPLLGISGCVAATVIAYGLYWGLTMITVSYLIRT